MTRTLKSLALLGIGATAGIAIGVVPNALAEPDAPPVFYPIEATTPLVQQDRVEFYKVTQDVKTNGIVRFIIKGDGCIKTEDATKLRLKSYDPSHHKVVYRCVQP